MRIRRAGLARLSLTLALCAGSALAQRQAALPAEPVSVPGPLLADFRVPIHSHPDDPAFGAYGTWAAGPDYKVSFHDGFTFYPLLGPDHPENLPVAWHTETVVSGDQVLAAAGSRPEHRHSDWRYEYHHAGVIEAYDVRRDGVEQTFVLASRPAAEGDLVVTARVATRLVAAPVLAGHGALVFSDARGTPVVRYGEAVAVDARGDRIAATTSFDGARIRLTVDGAWLARATFPVVLDPLTSRVLIHSSATLGPARDVELGHDGSMSTTERTVMVTFTRQFAANDLDAYGYLMTARFNSPSLAFSDVSTTLNSEKTTVAFCGAPTTPRWVIAFQRSPTSNSVSQIRLWVHDRNSTTGSMMFLGLTAAGTTDRNPDVGGFAGGLRANGLVVYQTDVTTNNANTIYTEVHGVLVNVALRTFGTPFVVSSLSSQPNYDREHPSVSQNATDSTGSWVVAWQELLHATAGDTWDIRIARIAPDGTRGALATATTPATSPAHKILPRIDGGHERYLVTYLLASSGAATAGTALHSLRFDALESASSFSSFRRGVLVPTNAFGSYFNRGVAYDRLTDSHWAVTYVSRSLINVSTGTVARLGHTGGVVETASLGGGNGDVYAGVTHHQENPNLIPNSNFLVAVAPPDNTGTDPVYGQRFTYPPDAINVSYGTGCGGFIYADPPLAGSEFFDVSLDLGATPSTPAILFLSDAAAAVDLSGAGMPGCFFNVGPAFFLTFPTTSAASGIARVQLALPDAPVLIGDLHFQWLYVQSGANPAGLLGTQGLRSQVR